MTGLLRHVALVAALLALTAASATAAPNSNVNAPFASFAESAGLSSTAVKRVVRGGAPPSAHRAPSGPAAVKHSSPYVPYRIYSAGWYRHKLVGRIYSTNGSCSGTLVARDIVLTAGHCVYFRNDLTGAVGWDSGWKFVAGQWGTGSYGEWFVRPQLPNAFTAARWNPSIDAWARGQGIPDWSQDYGFIKLGPDSAGRYPGDVLGYAGIVANQVGDFWSLGYPGGGFFSQWCAGSRGDGTTTSCYGYYTYSPYGDYAEIRNGANEVLGYELGMGNYMTGGSSGGPWFMYYNGAWNHVASVNSHCEPQNCKDASVGAYSRNMWGPYFTDQTLAEFAEVQRS